MKRILFVFSLTISLFVSPAQAEYGPISTFFEPIPESRAHSNWGVADETEFNPKSIKVLVWNIKKASLDNWQREFLLYGQDRDLFLIQEGFRSPLFNATLKSFNGFRWDMGASFIYIFEDYTRTGTVIGSRVNPSETIVRHSPDNEPVIGTPKTITFAKYPLKDMKDDLLVVSVHAINLTTGEAFKRHMTQVYWEINMHTGPVLFAGDFNTWTEKRFKILKDLTLKLSLNEIVFKNGQHRMKFRSNFLDHGFVRGLKVTNAQVHPESSGSDHKPLTLELSAN